MALSRRTLFALGAVLATGGLTVLAPAAFAKPEIGKPAPDFTGVDSKGRQVALSSLRGKTVVLEWTNHDCPYVRKHYGAGNMQKLQAEATGEGVVWLSVISSEKGADGHVSAAEADKLTASRKASPSHVLLDEKGVIGRKYEARTTPHMFVINAEGSLVYMGGIDDRATTDKADIGRATNYVREALDAVRKGEPVKTPVSRPYGCSIKYAPEESRS